MELGVTELVEVSKPLKLYPDAGGESEAVGTKSYIAFFKISCLALNHVG